MNCPFDKRLGGSSCARNCFAAAELRREFYGFSQWEYVWHWQAVNWKHCFISWGFTLNTSLPVCLPFSAVSEGTFGFCFTCLRPVLVKSVYPRSLDTSVCFVFSCFCKNHDQDPQTQIFQYRWIKTDMLLTWTSTNYVLILLCQYSKKYPSPRSARFIWWRENQHLLVWEFLAYHYTCEEEVP